MIQFDPSDPFPLLSPDSHSYREAQEHSALVDAWIGLETEKIEAALSAKGLSVPIDVQQLWIGLPSQALQTPFTEIRHLLSLLSLREGQRLVDLGAGYGRMGFVVGRHFAGVEFIGYEYVPERVAESKRALAKFAYPNVKMTEADLASRDFNPCDADVYFLYDYGSRDAIAKTLGDLREIASRRSITVVGRGRASRDAIERGQPWLSQVVAPKHHDHFSIYCTTAGSSTETASR